MKKAIPMKFERLFVDQKNAVFKKFDDDAITGTQDPQWEQYRASELTQNGSRHTTTHGLGLSSQWEHHTILDQKAPSP